MPNLRLVPNPRAGAQTRRLESIGFVLPLDDTHFRVYTVARVKQRGELTSYRSRQNGKLWEDLTEAEHQRYPGDYEAQKSQGDITWHSDEHFGTTDLGISMLRRLMKEQAAVVAQGGDPMGVIRDPAKDMVRFEESVEVDQPGDQA